VDVAIALVEEGGVGWDVSWVVAQEVKARQAREEQAMAAARKFWKVMAVDLVLLLMKNVKKSPHHGGGSTSFKQKPPFSDAADGWRGRDSQKTEWRACQRGRDR
jgi:hypothetical protein